MTFMDSKTCNSPMFNRDSNKDFNRDFKHSSGNRINSIIMKTKTIFLMDSDLLTLLAGFSLEKNHPALIY